MGGDGGVGRQSRKVQGGIQGHRLKRNFLEEVGGQYPSLVQSGKIFTVVLYLLLLAKILTYDKKRQPFICAFPLWFYFTYFLFHKVNFYYIKSRAYFLFPLCPYNFFRGKGETKITLSMHGGAKRRIHFPLKTEGHSSCLLEDLFFSLFFIFYFLSWRFVVVVVVVVFFFFFSFGVLDEIRSSVWTIFVIYIYIYRTKIVYNEIYDNGRIKRKERTHESLHSFLFISNYLVFLVEH